MGIFLLLSSFFLLFCLFFLTLAESGLYTRARLSIVLSLIANGIIAFIYSEVFSVFDAIGQVSATIFWSLVAILFSVLLWYLNRRGKIRLADLLLLRAIGRLKGLSVSNRIITWVSLLLIVIPLFFLAVYAPANNFDGHSYHLNRVLFWINDGNLGHFPTQHIFQLYLNVFAEYLVLQTFLLSGSDYFSGLIQFGSFIGSLSLISLLAKKFGSKTDTQLLACLLLLTLPIGIFESTSVQVDYVACFFFIAYVYFGYSLLEERSWITLSAMLVSLSLGGFTKYPVLIFAIPFTVYFAVCILIQYRFTYAVKVVITAIVILLVTFAPFFSRNYQLLGHIMSPPEDSRLFAEKIPSDKHSFLFTVSGIVKNASLHLNIPSTAVNLSIEKVVRNLHDKMGVDIDDPALRLDRFQVRYSVHEDMVPNTLHFLLILVGGVFVFFIPGARTVKWFWVCSFLGFVLFCTLLKFQLWSSRTHMPFFAMGIVLVSYIYSQVLRWKIEFLTIPFLAMSSLFVYGNPNKALVPVVYLTQKAVAHIPVAICYQDSLKLEMFRKHLSGYYLFEDGNDCHPLKQWPSVYGERRKVFSILEKYGYYDEDRNATVFGTSRAKGYFLSHLANYQSFGPLLDHMNFNHKNVGILFLRDVGFYHYWAAMAEKQENPGMMKYIRYRKELSVLENAKKPFCYDYILADDANLIRELIPKENIDTVYQQPLLRLIKLKKPSCDVYMF